MAVSIQDHLDEVVQLGGVRGAGVTTTDGIIVASALGGQFEEDVIAGLTSFLISTTKRAMDSGETLRRFVMHSTHGKLVLEDIGQAYLVVITDQFVRLDGLLSELGDVARNLRRLTSIS